MAGGLLVEHAGWPWIFWLNLPVGAVAVAIMWLFLHEEVVPRSRRLDLAGAGLLLVSLSALMLAFSLFSLGLLVLAVVCGVLAAILVAGLFAWGAPQVEVRDGEPSP